MLTFQHLFICTHALDLIVCHRAGAENDPEEVAGVRPPNQVPRGGSQACQPSGTPQLRLSDAALHGARQQRVSGIRVQPRQAVRSHGAPTCAYLLTIGMTLASEFFVDAGPRREDGEQEYLLVYIVIHLVAFTTPYNTVSMAGGERIHTSLRRFTQKIAKVNFLFSCFRARDFGYWFAICRMYVCMYAARLALAPSGSNVCGLSLIPWRGASLHSGVLCSASRRGVCSVKLP